MSYGRLSYTISYLRPYTNLVSCQMELAALIEAIIIRSNIMSRGNDRIRKVQMLDHL
jgi:hypothetical protein